MLKIGSTTEKRKSGELERDRWETYFNIYSSRLHKLFDTLERARRAVQPRTATS